MDRLTPSVLDNMCEHMCELIKQNKITQRLSVPEGSKHPPLYHTWHSCLAHPLGIMQQSTQPLQQSEAERQSDPEEVSFTW